MGLEAKGWRVAYANDLDPQKRRLKDSDFALIAYDDQALLGAGDAVCVRPLAA